MATQAIRDYLKTRGLNDNEITYDNGSVLAKGKRFMDATPQADGRTYADTKTLDNSYNDYDIRSQLADMRSKAQTPNPELAAMRQALQDRINKPAQQFSYNQNADPAYKAALESARQNTQTAAGNIAADMNKRGLLNSTITQDRGNQAAAQEYNRVSNEIAPRLEQAAYQRYLGQQQQENQQTGQMMQLANMYDNQERQQYERLAQSLGLQQGYNQQQTQNERAALQDALQQRQANISAASTIGQQLGRVLQPKDDWSNLYNQDDAPLNMQAQQVQYQQARDQIGDEQYKQKFDEDVRRFGIDTAMKQAAQTNAFANSAADNARANASLGMQQQRLDWERDPNNLDNTYKQAQINKLNYEGSTPNSKQFESEVISNLKNMTPELRKQFFDNEQETIVNSIGITGYNRMYNQYFDRYGDPK